MYLYPLKLSVDLVDAWPDVRNWLRILYCFILTSLYDLEVKIRDLQILFVVFYLRFKKPISPEALVGSS